MPMMVDVTISLVLSAMVVGVLLWLEREGLVELEWNPRSDASRAARAERAGNLLEALTLYDRAGQPEQVLACLHRNIPDSALRTALVGATRELLALKAALPMLDSPAAYHLRASGDRVLAYTHEVGGFLWLTAERLAVAFVLWEPLDEVSDLGPPEIEKLDNLTANVRQVRIALARAVIVEPESRQLDEAMASSPIFAESPRLPERLAS
jgi:hypothetical protein